MKNRDIIECTLITQSFITNPNEEFGDYETVLYDDGDKNTPVFKLLCNVHKNLYVLVVQGVRSLFIKDTKKFILNEENSKEMCNGVCETDSYNKALHVIYKIEDKLNNAKINRIFCVGFGDGGSISSAVAMMLKTGINFHNQEVLKKFMNGEVYGIIYATPKTFSPKANLETNEYILNFIMTDDYKIKQDRLKSGAPIVSIFDDIRINSLPGQVYVLSPKEFTPKTFFQKTKKIGKDFISYFGIIKEQFDLYSDAICELIKNHDDDDVSFFDTLKRKRMNHKKQSCKAENVTKTRQKKILQIPEEKEKTTCSNKQLDKISEIQRKEKISDNDDKKLESNSIKKTKNHKMQEKCLCSNKANEKSKENDNSLPSTVNSIDSNTTCKLSNQCVPNSINKNEVQDSLIQEHDNQLNVLNHIEQKTLKIKSTESIKVEKKCDLMISQSLFYEYEKPSIQFEIASQIIYQEYTDPAKSIMQINNLQNSEKNDNDSDSLNLSIKSNNSLENLSNKLDQIKTSSNSQIDMPDKQMISPKPNQKKKRLVHANTIQLGTIKINSLKIDDPSRPNSSSYTYDKTKSKTIPNHSPKFTKRRRLILHTKTPLYNTHKYY